MATSLLERFGGFVETRRRVLLFLIGIWSLLILGQLTPSFKMKPDSAYYLALARSLKQGKGYRVEGRFCRSYPPLFPLVLSAVGSSSRGDYRPEKFAISLMALGGLLGSYWLLSQRYRGHKLLVLALIVALSPAFVRASTMLLSDIPFFFFAIISMASANHFWRSERISWSAGVTFACTLALAGLTRAAALPFYLASLAWLARARLWRQDFPKCIVFTLLFLVIACTPVLGWLALTHSNAEEGTTSYADSVRAYLSGAKKRIANQGLLSLFAAEGRTILRQLSAAGEAVVGAGGPAGGAILGLILLPIGLLGLARRIRNVLPSDYLFCGYGIVVLLWPAYQGPRLWIPLLPLMLGYLADGIAGFGHLIEESPRIRRWTWLCRLDQFSGRLRGTIATLGATLLLLIGIVAGIGMVSKTWQESSSAINGVVLGGARLDVARFLCAPRERPVVLAYSRFLEVAPAVSNLESSVVSIPRGVEGNPEALLEQLELKGVTHLAVERKLKMTPWQTKVAGTIRAAIRTFPARFRLVTETSKVQIYEILPSG